MRDSAAERGVHVVVGYNKNVADYTRAAIDSLSQQEARGEIDPARLLEDWKTGPYSALACVQQVLSSHVLTLA